MRRLIAYIVLAISMLGLLVFNFQDKVENINYSQEFDNGTEVMYSISDPEGGMLNLEGIVEELGERLEEAGATSYKVERVEDKANNAYGVKISLGSRNSSNIDNILRSTMACGEFSVFTTDDYTIQEGTHLIKRNTAKVDYDSNSQAYITVEVDSKLQEVIDYAKNTTKNGLLVLWQGKPNDVDFENLSDDDFISSETKLTNIQAQGKVLAILDLSDASAEESEGSTRDANTKFYQDSDDENIHYLSFGVYGYSSSGASTNTFRAQSARSFERLFNSDLISYEITEIYRRTISADYGTSSISLLVWSATIAVVVTCGYLLICYGLMAISGCLGIGLTVLFDIIFLNLFNIQVNPVLILSLIVTLGVAANILCLYYRRTRDDVYNGRVIGKASNEGFRKTVSTSVDSTIVLFVLGIVLAVISGTSVKAFSIFFIFSSLFTIIFVFLIGKVLNNFLLNSNISNKLKLFNINKKCVADLDGNRESELPVTTLEKIDVKKHGKKAGIVTLAGMIIATGALSIFGITSSVFNFTNEPSYGRIEIRTTDKYMFTSKHNGVYPNGYQCDENLIAKDNFVIYIESIDDVKVNKAWTITDQVNPYDVEKNNYLYFYADLDRPLADDKFDLLENFVYSVTGEDAEYNTVFVHNYEVNSNYITNDFNNTLVLTSVMLGITLLYFIIRYRYSLALSSFAISAASGFIAFGLLSLFRFPVSAYVGMGVLSGLLLLNALIIPLANRINQLKNESKVKVTTYDQRAEIAYEGLKGSITPIVSLSLGTMIILGIMSLFVMKMSSIYIAMIITLLIGTLLIVFGLVPLHLWLERHLKFKKIKSKRAQLRQAKREKIAKTNRNKGAEPEEIIIPGIND